MTNGKTPCSRKRGKRRAGRDAGRRDAALERDATMEKRAQVLYWFCSIWAPEDREDEAIRNKRGLEED